MKIDEYFKSHTRMAIAFSGGCDSVFLLNIAKSAGCDVKPYYVNTMFQSRRDLKDSIMLSMDAGLPLVTINVDVLSNDIIRSNPADRCYHCKRAIFETIINQAHKDGYDVVADGTNASDDENDRPGVRALRELGVISPLKELELTKREIRYFSKQFGICTWNKPAAACLATRIPTGMTITKELLTCVEECENILTGMEYTDFRLRIDGSSEPDKGIIIGRLEVISEQYEKAVNELSAVKEALSAYCTDVILSDKTRIGMKGEL